jgi:hypothetical protein
VRCAICLGFLAFAAGVAGWVSTRVAEVRARACQSECSGHLCCIGTALLRYHEQYGCFPPAYIADKNGVPMHSWRVLLLEFLDPQLHSAYDFREPWDGPNNRKLADRMPNVFGCPNRRSSSPYKTSYVVVVGPDTMFPGETPRKLADVRDPHDTTILVVEIADSTIHWMAPRDLRVEDMSFVINDRSRPSLSSDDPAGPAACMLNCVRFRLRPNLRPETLKAMLTVAGGERIDPDEIVGR